MCQALKIQINSMVAVGGHMPYFVQGIWGAEWNSWGAWDKDFLDIPFEYIFECFFDLQNNSYIYAETSYLYLVLLRIQCYYDDKKGLLGLQDDFWRGQSHFDLHRSWPGVCDGEAGWITKTLRESSVWCHLWFRERTVGLRTYPLESHYWGWVLALPHINCVTSGMLLKYFLCLTYLLYINEVIMVPTV